MSEQTLHDIEEAIRAHAADRVNDPDHPRYEKNDIVIDWVVGYTVSNIVETEEGNEIVAYGNVSISPEGNPNAQVALAMWVSDNIASSLNPADETD